MADALTTKVIKDLAHGYNIEQVAERVGESTDSIFKVWQEYVSDRKQMSQPEQWLLHLIRLENLLVLAHEVIESNMDGKSIEAAVKLLERIEELQNLNLSRKQDAENENVMLTQKQVGLLFQVFNEMQNAFRHQLEEAFEGKKRIADIKGELLGDFDTKFMEIQKSSLEVVQNEAE